MMRDGKLSTLERVRLGSRASLCVGGPTSGGIDLDSCDEV